MAMLNNQRVVFIRVLQLSQSVGAPSAPWVGPPNVLLVCDPHELQKKIPEYPRHPKCQMVPHIYIYHIYIYKSPTKQCFFKGVFNIRGMGLVISTRNHQIQLGFCAKLAILKTEACKNHFGRSSSLNASVPNDGAKRPSFRG